MAINVSKIDPETLYLVVDAAGLLEVSEQTVRTYLKDGTLPGVKNKKGRWRVRGRDIINFIQGSKATH